eukprot:TRINITY_DN12759_c0_g1_i2.p1 TRINITY_DN12759_c0_g1~~TRINITY_DN12759_c0_g1_i2.p1  ORF type:complete len:229 (+),score=54.21 TRINITY_DN12759_c0_g1_i2:246-932(+)
MGNSVGCGSKKRRNHPIDELDEEQGIADLSELVHLRLTTPIQRQIDIHSLSSVRILQQLVAVELGLDKCQSELIQIEFSNQILRPSDIVQNIGLADDAQIHASGIHHPIETIQSNSKAAKQVNLMDAVQGNNFPEVELVLKFYPKRLKEHWNGVTALQWARKHKRQPMVELLDQEEAQRRVVFGGWARKSSGTEAVDEKLSMGQNFCLDGALDAPEVKVKTRRERIML